MSRDLGQYTLYLNGEMLYACALAVADDALFMHVTLADARKSKSVMRNYAVHQTGLAGRVLHHSAG